MGRQEGGWWMEGHPHRRREGKEGREGKDEGREGGREGFSNVCH